MQVELGFIGFGCESVTEYEVRSGCCVFYLTASPPGILRLIDVGGAHPHFLVGREYSGLPTSIAWLRVGSGRLETGVLMSGLDAVVLSLALILVAMAAAVAVLRRRRPANAGGACDSANRGRPSSPAGPRR